MNVKTFPYIFFEDKVIKVIHRGKHKEWDSTIMILGREGSGKSNLALAMLESIAKVENKEADISWVCQSLKEFIMQLRQSPKGANLLLDEGSDLASIRTLESLSKAVTKAFTVMRAKCLFTVICFTNLMRINTYFREDRVKGLIYIRKRGVAYFFTHSQIVGKILPAIRKNKMTDIKALGRFKPLFAFTFPKYEGKLLEAYLNKKTDNIDETLSDLEHTFSATEPTLSKNKAIQYLQIDKNLAYWLLDNNKIENEGVANGRYIYKKDSLDEWKKLLKDKEKYSFWKHQMLTAHPERQNKVIKHYKDERS
jgi:hypothetical protein